MNELEQALIDRVLDAIHGLELKVVEEVSNVKGDIGQLAQKGTTEHAALRETVERNISTDTERLNKHANELDEHRKAIAMLVEWKDNVNRSINNRVAIIGGGMAIGAVIIAFFLDKI